MTISLETAARERLRQRAELVLPGKKSAVALADERLIVPPDAAVVCAIRRADEGPIPGFTKVADRSHRHQVPLHRVLAGVHPILGWPFEPENFFHHVGSRLCARPAPGWREECWVRDGVDLPGALSATASPVTLAWITVGGIGYLPVVGATMASVATAGLAFALGFLIDWNSVRLVMAALVGITIIASLFVERAAARHFLTNDPREFVLDEVAGMAVALLFVPPSSWALGVGIALVGFRFFDVLKPGIEWVERTPWRGTIVWDDVLAGLYAGIVTFGLTYFLR